MNKTNTWCNKACYVILFSLIYLLSACSTVTDTQVDEKSSFYYYSAGKRKIIYKYMTSTGGFFPIPTGQRRFEVDADPKTFQVLSNTIGKDANNVFFSGGKVGNVDAATFEILGDGLYRDKNNIYRDNISNGAEDNSTLAVYSDFDAATFELIDSTSIMWAKDKKGVIYAFERLDVDKETFQLISHNTGYDKDSFYMFATFDVDLPKAYAWHGEPKRLTKYAIADDELLIMYTYNKYNRLETHPVNGHNSVYVYDSASHILEFNGKLYWENNICDITPDKATFKAIDERYRKDKDHVYLTGKIIPYANPARFEVIDLFMRLSKDDKHVFYRYDIIEGVDPKTVVYEEWEHGSEILKDKNYLWKHERGAWKRYNK